MQPINIVVTAKRRVHHTGAQHTLAHSPQAAKHLHSFGLKHAVLWDSDQTRLESKVPNDHAGLLEQLHSICRFRLPAPDEGGQSTGQRRSWRRRRRRSGEIVWLNAQH